MSDSTLIRLSEEPLAQIMSYFSENESIRLYLTGSPLLSRKITCFTKKLHLKWKSYKFVDMNLVFGFAALFDSLESFSFHDESSSLVKSPVSWHLLPQTLKHLDLDFVGCLSSFTKLNDVSALWPTLETLSITEKMLALRMLRLTPQHVALHKLGLPSTLRSINAFMAQGLVYSEDIAALHALPHSMERISWSVERGDVNLSPFHSLLALSLSVPSTANLDVHRLPSSIMSLNLAGAGLNFENVVWNALFPQLTALDLRFCPKKTTRFSEILEMPSSLTSLDLKLTNEPLTPNETEWLRSNASRFVQFPWNPATLQELEHFTSLTNFVEHRDRSVSDSTPITLPPNITALSLYTSCPTNYPLGLTSIRAQCHELSASLLHLRYLHTFKAAFSLSRSDFEALPSSLTSIKAHFGFNVWEIIATALPLLRRIVSRCDLFGDDNWELTQPPQLPPKLEYLEFQDGRLTDEFLPSFRSNTSIRELVVAGGNSLSFMEDLPMGLTELSFHPRGMKFTDELVSKLPRSLTGLYLWTGYGFAFPFSSSSIRLLPPHLKILGISPFCHTMPTDILADMPPYLCIKLDSHYYVPGKCSLVPPGAANQVTTIPPKDTLNEGSHIVQ